MKLLLDISVKYKQTYEALTRVYSTLISKKQTNKQTN